VFVKREKDAGNTYVKIATVLVADTSIAVGIRVTAGLALALEEAVLAARMGSVGIGNGVGLPDVHLGAACSVLAATSVLVVWARVPALGVGGTVDPLHVVRTLSIAVTFQAISNVQGKSTN
jgi:hypothetical protein